jgi:hypothetical protein
MVDALLRWCEKCPDCYNTSQHICQWADVLIPICGAEETFSHLFFTIPKYVPRFSQSFRGLVMVLRENNYPDAATALENAVLIADGSDPR